MLNAHVFIKVAFPLAFKNTIPRLISKHSYRFINSITFTRAYIPCSMLFDGARARLQFQLS